MFSKRSAARCRSGLTLIELMVVAAILAILAGAMVPLVEHFVVTGRQTSAMASLVQIRNAIMGTSDQPGYLEDTGQLPPTLNALFVNPFSPSNPFSATNPSGTFDRNTGRGWRGPYLLNATGQYTINNTPGFTSAYGNNGDSTILDPWGNPIILQYPYPVTSPEPNASFARLISAGPNGIIDTPQNYGGNVYPPSTSRGDDIVLFIDHADAYP